MKARVSIRVKARVLGGSRATGDQGAIHECGEVEHKRAERWKYW